MSTASHLPREEMSVGRGDCMSSQLHGPRQSTPECPSVFKQQTSVEETMFDIATEKRCRNVLVRYCAHVPRNFQYCDGVQVWQVFLILRDHLGDEDLGIAGGVLYELIEVDCAHSDDPGAGFQRWRRDHMNRHADFNLPHIPHLTTVTSAVKPSSVLVRWRLNHPSRYPVRLSDHGGVGRRSFGDPTCLKNRKAWAIEHTMYMSTRNGGTSIVRSISSTRLHRLQWNLEGTKIGRFVEEKEFMASGENSSRTAEFSDSHGILRSVSRPRSSSAALAAHLVRHLGKIWRNRDATRSKQLHTATVVGIDGLIRRKALPQTPQNMSACLVCDECLVPNPIFARKHMLVSQNRPLPQFVSRRLMRTANSVSTYTGSAAADSVGVFRGPFTPQLGFDGGHDFEWDMPPPPVPTLTRAEGNNHLQHNNCGQNPRARKQASHHNAARQAHDWFGLDEDILRARADDAARKPPTRGYNWFGLD